MDNSFRSFLRDVMKSFAYISCIILIILSNAILLAHVTEAVLIHFDKGIENSLSKRGLLYE
jgi:hypothetical protein